MNFQNLLSRQKVLSMAFNSHMSCYIVINNFFRRFEVSGWSQKSSQNILRLINKFQKCIPSFVESLIDDFIKFSGAIAKFLFLERRFYFQKGDWALDYVCTQFRCFAKISLFSKFVSQLVIQFVVIMIQLYYLR